MLDLVLCEFQKLKRRKFITLTMGVACLFPLPVLFLALRQQQAFYMLFRMVFIFGEMLFLPCVLGVLSTIIFLTEDENDVLKNILTVPVSRTKIFLSKCIMLMILAIIYCLLELSASILFAFMIGNVTNASSFILFSILSGVFIFTCSMPVVLFVITFGKNFTVSNIASFIYGVICFALAYMCTGPGGEVLLKSKIGVLPIVMVFRWYLGYFPLEERLEKFNLYVVPTPVMIGYILIFLAITVFIGVLVYRKKEV